MGGVDVGGGGGKGKRKATDSEINMIPMIDLLMVTISFLLITAVWTHLARIDADAQVPGPPRPDVELAAKIQSEWKARGQHAKPTDPRFDQAILHTDDKTEFKYLIGVIDAIDQTRRDRTLGGKAEQLPAFHVTFAVN